MEGKPADVLVVLGFAEALSAPEVVWSLADAGYGIIAFSRRGRRPPLRQSRYVKVHEITAPEIDCRSTRAELARLLTDSAAARPRLVLLPLDDAALWLSGQLPTNAPWCLAGPTGPQAALALDKGRQIEQARRAGFRVPESAVVTHRGEFIRSHFRPPLILRPAYAAMERDGRLSKGRNWICSDATELHLALDAWAERGTLLVQPFITGTGEGIFGLATDHGITAWSGHRRLRMMNPHGSGSSACISHPVSADARAATEQFIDQTRWRGLFMIELLRDFAGNLWFVEFNGRPWGSMALSRRQGLEYPAWTVACTLAPDRSFEVKPTESKPVVCRHIGRELMHLLFILRGPKSKAMHAWPSFWRTAFELLAVRQGDAFYNWRRDDARVFFSDWWCTLRDNLYKSRN